MPTMNAAQVRALSVEDVITWPEFRLVTPNENKQHMYVNRAMCNRFVRPELNNWYYVLMPESNKDVTTGDMIVWLLAIQELEVKLGAQAKVVGDDDGLEAIFTFSKPTTEMERQEAQAWLDASPVQALNGDILRWRKPVAFGNNGNVRYEDVPAPRPTVAYGQVEYEAIVNPYVVFDEVVPDVPQPADEAGI